MFLHRQCRRPINGENGIEVDRSIDLDGSSWIAARALGVTGSKAPDAESHTNPVYVDIGEKAPYNRDSIDRLIARSTSRWPHTASEGSPRRPGCWTTSRSRATSCCGSARRAACRPAGFPDAWVRRCGGGGIDPSQRTHPDEELSGSWSRLPAKTPARRSRRSRPSMASGWSWSPAEPLVQSPVAAAFDADGNLYVAEMRDYPYKPKPGGKPLGTVRLLRDTDGDGRFEAASRLRRRPALGGGHRPLERGRVRDCAAGHLVLEGHRRRRHGRRARKGLHRLRHPEPAGDAEQPDAGGSTTRSTAPPRATAGRSGTANEPQAPAVSVEQTTSGSTRSTASFEPISGYDQFGNTFDDWGNRFICDESQPLSSRCCRALPGPQPVSWRFPPASRTSPAERCRSSGSARSSGGGRSARAGGSRTATRSAESAGASHHVVDAGAGVTIYRGGAYPAEFYGNVFVGDAQNNLVHRRILVPDGPTFKSAARRPRTENTEFVRSSDNWFRPVNFVNAPDGTLYVLDMSREVIEAIHIPLDVVKHLDLKRGRDQGRIYRIAPPGFRYSPGPSVEPGAPPPSWSRASSNVDAWYRDTAHRLIYRAAGPCGRRAVAGDARRSEAPLPQTRVDALWSLQGLKSLEDRDIMIGYN